MRPVPGGDPPSEPQDRQEQPARTGQRATLRRPPLHQQNLADCERVLGADHPETLVARANLAYLYALQDQPARAITLHQRNLTGYERVHGPDHPHTLNARVNLASCYHALGTHEQG